MFRMFTTPKTEDDQIKAAVTDLANHLIRNKKGQNLPVWQHEEYEMEYETGLSFIWKELENGNIEFRKVNLNTALEDAETLIHLLRFHSTIAHEPRVETPDMRTMRVR